MTSTSTKRTTRRSTTVARAEASGDSYITVEAIGLTWRMLPASEWRTSTLTALRLADYDSWAGKVLHSDDHDQWLKLDPTVAEVGQLLMAAQAASGGGDVLGELRRSVVTQSSTARR